MMQEPNGTSRASPGGVIACSIDTTVNISLGSSMVLVLVLVLVMAMVTATVMVR